jgi:hypothetical protein
MHARPYAGCAIVAGKGGEGPHHIHEIFHLADRPAPHILVAMGDLGGGLRVDFDGLCRVELNAIAPWRENGFDNGEDEPVLDQCLGMR